MNDVPNEKWITVAEAADYLRVKPATLRAWIKSSNSIPAHKIGKFWRFKRSELDLWVKSDNGIND